MSYHENISISFNCLDCLFCTSTVTENASLNATNREVLTNNIIKFLYFNKLHHPSVKSNQSFSNHSQLPEEEYYRSVFEDSSTSYCHLCIEKIEDIIKTLQQLEELEAHLNTLQHEILGQLHDSFCSSSKFNEYRRQIITRLESSLGLSTTVSAPSQIDSAFSYYEDPLEDYETKLIPDIDLVTKIDPTKAYVKLIRLEESSLEGRSYMQQLIKNSKSRAKLRRVRSNNKRQAESTPDPLRVNDNESVDDNFYPDNDYISNSEDSDRDSNFEICEENDNPPKIRRRLTAKTIRMNYAAIKVASGQPNLQIFYLKCQYPACTEREATVVLLRDHVRKSHLSSSASTNTNSFCESCGKDFSDNFTELEKHASNHTRINKHEYSCKFCSAILLTSSSIHGHFKRFHRDLYEQNERLKLKTNSESLCQCKYCKCLCINLNDLWTHVRTKHIKPKMTILSDGNIDKIMYECKFCPKSYNTAKSTRRHETTTHKDEVLRMASSAKADEPIKSKSSDSEIIIKEENLSFNEYEITESIESPFEFHGDDNENSSKLSKIKATAEEKQMSKLFSDAQLIKLIMEEKIFYCQYTNCLFTSANVDSLEVHVKEEHLKGIEIDPNNICNKCGLEFLTIESSVNNKEILVQNHKLHKHASSAPESNQVLNLNCKFCSRSFIRPCQLLRHFIVEHSELYQDLMSGKDINPNLETSVSKEDEENSRCECKFCPLSLSYKYLFAHMKNRHEHHLFQTSVDDLDQQKKTYKCNFCPFSTLILSSIWEHLRKHHLRVIIENPDSVVTPAAITRPKDSTKDPIAISKPQEQEHICEICGLTYSKKHTLVHHMKSHNRGFPCTLCSAEFTKQESLEKHQSRNHAKKLGLPLFVCDQCGRVLNDPGSLKYHIRAVHNKAYIYTCELCPHKCMKKSQLQTHMLNHTKELPHRCHICPAGFKLRRYLVRHIRKHTGEKPFVCKYCGKGFTGREHWKRHEPIHESARPFPCLLCGVRFPTFQLHKIVEPM